MKTVLAILLCLVCSPAWADYWNWTPPAQHHAAVVKIQCGPYGGSGTLISTDGVVATAYHVIETGGQTTCTWQNGYRSRATVISGNRNNDVAFLRVQAPQDAIVIPACPDNQQPQVGDTLEYLGFGGPSQRLRHFSGKVLEVEAGEIHGAANLLNGDSGGAVVWNGYLVGTISGGRQAVPQAAFEDGTRWPLHYPARSGRVHVRTASAPCPGGRCQPQPIFGGNIFGGGRQQSAPPQQQPQQQSPQVAPPQTTPQPDISAELKQLNAEMRALLEKMKQCPCPQQPAQPIQQTTPEPKAEPIAGPPGKDGRDGKDGKDATVDYEKLADAVAVKISAQVLQQMQQEITVNQPSVSQPAMGSVPAYFQIRPRKK